MKHHPKATRRREHGRRNLRQEKFRDRLCERPVVNEAGEVNGGAVRMTCVSMGNPHTVWCMYPDTAGLNLPVLGTNGQRHSNKMVSPRV